MTVAELILYLQQACPPETIVIIDADYAPADDNYIDISLLDYSIEDNEK